MKRKLEQDNDSSAKRQNLEFTRQNVEKLIALEPEILSTYYLQKGLRIICKAIVHSKKDIIKLFIEKGANFNVSIKPGFTLLHLVAQHNQLEILKLLLTYQPSLLNTENNINAIKLVKDQNIQQLLIDTRQAIKLIKETFENFDEQIFDHHTILWNQELYHKNLYKKGYVEEFSSDSKLVPVWKIYDYFVTYYHSKILLKELSEFITQNIDNCSEQILYKLNELKLEIDKDNRGIIIKNVAEMLFIMEMNNLVEKDEIPKVKFEIDKKYPINKDEKSYHQLATLMYYATAFGYVKLVNLFVHMGVPLESKIDNNTFLTIAVKQLIKHNECSDEYTKAEKDYENIIRILKQHGASLDEIAHLGGRDLYNKFKEFYSIERNLDIHEYLNSINHFNKIIQNPRNEEDDDNENINHEFICLTLNQGALMSFDLDIKATPWGLAKKLEEIRQIFKLYDISKVALKILDYNFIKSDEAKIKVEREGYNVKDDYIDGLKEGEIESWFKVINTKSCTEVKLYFDCNLLLSNIEELCKQLKNNDCVSTIEFGEGITIDSAIHKRLSEFLMFNKSLKQFHCYSDDSINGKMIDNYASALQNNKTLISFYINTSIPSFRKSNSQDSYNVYKFRNKNYLNALLNKYKEIVDFDPTKGFSDNSLYKIFQVVHKNELARHILEYLSLSKCEKYNGRKDTLKMIYEKFAQVSNYIEHNFFKITHIIKNAGIADKQSRTINLNFKMDSNDKDYEINKQYYLRTQEKNKYSSQIASYVIGVEVIDDESMKLDKMEQNAAKDFIKVTIEVPVELFLYAASFIGDNSLWEIHQDFA